MFVFSWDISNSYAESPSTLSIEGPNEIVAASGLEHVLILCPSSLQIEQRGLVFTREMLVAETGFSSFPGFGLLM